MANNPLPEEWVLYLAKIRLAGPLWFTSMATPYPQGFVQRTRPVVHDYALNLAFAGRLSEAYVGAYDHPSYTPLSKLFEDTGAYVYPAIVVRPVYRKIFMSMSETTSIVYKPQTRAAVPLRVSQIALDTGTRMQTYVIARPDSIIAQTAGRKPLVGRLGQKRYGVFEAELTPLGSTRLVTGESCTPNHPFNTSITLHSSAQPIILPHRAGDIALTGVADYCIRAALPNGARLTHPTIDLNRLLPGEGGGEVAMPEVVLALPEFILKELLEE